MNASEQTIYIAYVWVSAFLAFISILFLSILYLQQKKLIRLEREKLNSEVRTADHVRLSVATELHNDISAYLAGIQMRLKSLSIAEEEIKIKESLQALDLCITKIKSMTRELSPVSLYRYSFMQGLKNYIQEQHFDKTLQITLIEKSAPKLSDEANNHVYRILQEMILNTVKHSQANRLTIEISETPQNKLLIRTEDNGKGFDYDKMMSSPNLGHGLMAIESRINYLNGNLDVMRDPKGGMHFNFTIPIS